MLDSDRAIHIRLTKEVIKGRIFRTGLSPGTPRFVEVDQYCLGGEVSRRIRIILRGNGCSKPTCTMCPLPNEGLNPKGGRINADRYVEQVETALTSHPGCEMVCIYNDGSFFSERELQREARRAIYRLIGSYGCRYLMVESLPSFITRASLEEAGNLLQDVKVIVGIGLQSASEPVRELCVNSPVTTKAFLKAIRLLRECGFAAKAYVMVKPPFLSENEAIEDASSTVLWLNDLKVQDITLCPTRIANGTLVSELFKRKLYYPPMLTSVVECLKNIQGQGVYARVSLFNVYSSDFQAYTPGGCAECEGKIIDGIELYNRSPCAVSLETLSCAKCSTVARGRDPLLFRGVSLQDRVLMFLNNRSIKEG